MTVDGSIVNAVLGFLGSLMLFYPGWQASKNLKQIEQVRAIVSRKQPPATKHDPGQALLAIMTAQHGRWRPLHHYALMAGMGLLFLSFAVDLALTTMAA